MGNRVELVTARLHLRRTRPGDAPALFNNYTGDPHCARFLQRRPHADVAHTQAMLQDLCGKAWERADTEPFAWVISLRDSDEAIGLFLAFPSGHKLEFHYGIGERFWGQGLIAEAGRAVLPVLWNTPRTQRIWTVCDSENTGSRRVLEKLGLHCEGTLKKWLVLPAFGEEARDCLVFSTTARPGSELNGDAARAARQSVAA